MNYALICAFVALAAIIFRDAPRVKPSTRPHLKGRELASLRGWGDDETEKLEAAE